MASRVTFPDFKVRICLLICFIGIASASNLIPSATNVVSSLIPTLSTNFYFSKCPDALSTINNEITSAVKYEPRLGASLLRLHFHDCFVQGCDASVLLKDTPTFRGEQSASPNINSLRGFDLIDKVKTKLETMCPNTVSCADILAVAARDSVVALGGASWAVRVGRRDSTTADFDAANSELPSPFLDLKPLIAAFGNKGFSADEMVALSGAHTIGRSKCALFRNRIYNESNNIEFWYANELKQTCPKIGGDTNLSPLDTTTRDFFDDAFYRNLLIKKGLLHSDQQLYSGGSTNTKVFAYAFNPSLFKNDFANAMLKMSNLSPPIGYPSQIRKYCGRVN